MIKSFERWRNAQQAELDHEVHEDGVTPRSHAEVYFSNYWNSDLEALSDAKVLSVGSGTGMSHSLEICDLNVALDPLNHHISDVITENFAELITGAGEALPFDCNSFDAVICFNVIDHTHHPMRVLRQIYDVLTSEGKLYIASNTFAAPKFVRHRLDAFDPPHPYHFSPNELRSRLTTAGFKIDYYNSSPRYNIVSIPQFLRNRSFRKVGALLFRIRWTTAVASLASE